MGFNDSFADEVLRSRNRSLFDPPPGVSATGGAGAGIGAAVGAQAPPPQPLGQQLPPLEQPPSPVATPVRGRMYGDVLPAGDQIPSQLQGMTPEAMSAMARFLDGVANQNRENEALKQIVGSSAGYLSG